VAHATQRKSNEDLRGKIRIQERMLADVSATKSSFESESGAALEAKNAALKESSMEVQESKAAAEEAWRQLTMLTAERDGLLRKVAEQERASHALSQLAGDREEGAQAVAAERSAHEKTKREIVQLQVRAASVHACAHTHWRTWCIIVFSAAPIPCRYSCSHTARACNRHRDPSRAWRRRTRPTPGC
jgi:hypothetical protein